MAAVEHLQATLSNYLAVVAAALTRRGIEVLAVRREPIRPGQALTASVQLDPVNARPGLGWGPVAAVWHEEQGWWVELCCHAPGPDPALARRYLPADHADDAVAAYHSAVAEFVAGLARGEDLGTLHPTPHRPTPPRPTPTRRQPRGDRPAVRTRRAAVPRTIGPTR
jgi:hypothetical protein